MKPKHYLPLIFLITQTLLPSLAQSQTSRYIVIKAAFHLHTTYSGADLTPAQVVEGYWQLGYRCITITDYNSVSGSFAGIAEAKAKAAKLGMIVIGGQEIISQFPLNNGNVAFKHILALFLSQPITNPWQTYRTNNVQYYFDAIHRQGGIGIVAHSWALNDKVLVGTSQDPWWQFVNASYIDGWEIFNYAYSSSMTGNEISTVLARRKTVLDSHDMHRAAVAAKEYNLLFCNNSTEAGVKDALLNRRLVVMYYGKVYGTNESLNLYHQYCG